MPNNNEPQMSKNKKKIQLYDVHLSNTQGGTVENETITGFAKRKMG